MCDQGHEEIIDRLGDLESAFREYNGELCDIKDDVTEIKDFLIGDIKKNEPGLAERIRAIETWKDGRKWFERLIITVVVSQFILYVLMQLNILPN